MGSKMHIRSIFAVLSLAAIVATLGAIPNAAAAKHHFTKRPPDSCVFHRRVVASGTICSYECSPNTPGCSQQICSGGRWYPGLPCPRPFCPRPGGKISVLINVPCGRVVFGSTASNTHGSVRLAGRLPSLDPRHFVNQHHDVEREVIADRKSHPGLYGDDCQYGCDRREPRRKQEAHYGGQRIAERIDDGIAIITGRNGTGTIAFNDKRAVLEDLPRRFQHDGQTQPRPDGQMFEDEPEEKIKPKAVQQV